MRYVLRWFITLLVTTVLASAQTRMPAYQVSTETNNFDYIPQDKNTAQKVFDWLDDNLLVDTNQFISLRPTNDTVQAVFMYIDGLVPTDASDTNQLMTESDADTNVYLKASVPDVYSSNIVNGTVANEDMATNSVTTQKILDYTILGEDIADGAITTNKLAPGFSSNVLYWTTSRLLGYGGADVGYAYDVTLVTNEYATSEHPLFYRTNSVPWWRRYVFRAYMGGWSPLTIAYAGVDAEVVSPSGQTSVYMTTSISYDGAVFSGNSVNSPGAFTIDVPPGYRYDLRHSGRTNNAADGDAFFRWTQVEYTR